MTKIRTIIVEDEKKSLLTLQSLIKRYCGDIEVIGTGGSVKEAYEVITAGKPNLVFLDIAMPDGDAFDLLKKLGKINFEIVFITAYNDYALKAFDFSALRYLLKPVNHLELIETVNRYQRIQNDSQINEQIEMLHENMQNQFAKITLPTNEGLIILEIDQIVRIEASSNYSHFYLINHTDIIVSKPLSHFTKNLEDLHFFRIHNTHMVNMNYVVKYNKGRGGSVTLKDGSQVSVSASRKKDFLDQLNHLSVKLG